MFREARRKQIAGLGGTCAKCTQSQPSLSAVAATREAKNTTTWHNFEIAIHTMAESSHTTHERGEECKKQYASDCL